MGRICPHCNHARKADESAPDWQCPACQRAYDKAGNAMAPEGFRQYGGAAAEKRGLPLGKWLLVLLLAGAAWAFVRPALQERAALSAKANAAQPEVVLYATDWCGYCKMTRELFAANGIRYTEYDIEKNSEALARHRKLGGNGVPLIVVGDEVINGYDEGALRQLLAPWFKS